MRETIYRDEAIRVVRHPAMEFTDADTRQKMIEALPSADRPQGWIPCSERLPNVNGRYLVTERIYAIDDRFYNGSYRTKVEEVEFADGKWDRAKFIKIAAWQPKPEPWKGADDEASD